jgi:hypothetical protein
VIIPAIKKGIIMKKNFCLTDIRSKIIGLFAISIFLFMAFFFLWVLPKTKEMVMKQKQDQLQYLVQNVMSLLNDYHQDEQQGKLSREEAQQRALTGC